MNFKLSAFAVAAMLLLCPAANASPWAEVGDADLRADIEILAGAGVIDDITMQWPLPWASIVTRLRARDALAQQPAYVRAAAARVVAAAADQMQFGTLTAAATVDATNAPNVVRDFGALGRETAIGQLSAEYMSQTTAVRVALGAEHPYHGGGAAFIPDGSYIAQKVGGAVFYAGYLTHWWGPGWISSLSLSDNARPFPQIGFARDQTDAFDTPWLSWIGPWQFEFFVGVLDGPRLARNTLYVGTRFAINPIPHLEIGFARTTQLCGTGHRCVPIADYFNSGLQTIANPNATNDESTFDFKYSDTLGGWPFQIYMQLMNEDNGPFVQSATSHLFGASVWLPIADNPLRLTFEYTDSIATANIFSFGNVDHGTAYNNTQYPDGMRYRGRTLGFSLDGDSRLATAQASWRDSDNWTYEVTYNYARVSDALNPSFNAVTTAPVRINLGEARVRIPLHNLTVELAGRLQDDQPRPDHGFLAAAEISLSYRF